MKMKKRDILFLCQYSYPEQNSSATLPFDTAKHLSMKGWTVDVLCGWPKEYSQNRSAAREETVEGVHIKRLHYLQLSRSGKIGRLLNFFSFTMAVLMRLGRLRRYRCVLVYSNPPILPLICVLANMLFGTCFVFVCYDVYPEIACAAGSLSPRSVISRAMIQINSRVFRRASQVVALTEEMRDYLLTHRKELDASRVSVIPNWAHEEALREKAQKTETETVTVSYLGNLGICQDVETLLSAMEQLQSEPRLQFLIAGHGSKREDLIRRTQDLANVHVLDFLVDESLAELFAKSDCGIVSLETGLRGMCAPSKYYSYLYGGQAVFAIVDADSYLAEELAEEEIGFSVSPGEGERLAEQLRALLNDREGLQRMKRCARALYTRRYARAHAMKAYEELLCGVLDR